MITREEQERIERDVLNRVVEQYSRGKLNWDSARMLLRQFNGESKGRQSFDTQMSDLLVTCVKTSVLSAGELYEARIKQLNTQIGLLEHEKNTLQRALAEAHEREKSLIRSAQELESSNLRAKSQLAAEIERHRKMQDLLENIREDDWLRWLVDSSRDYPDFFLPHERQEIHVLRKRMIAIGDLLEQD